MRDESHIGEKFPGLHAEETSKVPLHLDAGRHRAPPYGHLGDLAVRVEQDVVHPVDGPYSTTSSARIPDSASLSAPPCMQPTKNSTRAAH